MTRNPSMRASDAERDKVAAELQEHCAQGRLTVDEFQERMERAYVARTLGDLDRLTEDLPAEDLYQLPVPAKMQVSRPSRARTDIDRALPGGMWPWLWGAWGSTGLLGLVCYLVLQVVGATGAADVCLWTFAGVLVPWGLIQGAAQASERGKRSR